MCAIRLGTEDDAGDEDAARVERIQQVFEQKLNLICVNSIEISDCLHPSGTRSAAKLETLAVEMYRQQKKAELVFDMLDEAGKGVIVMQDLQRVYSEVLRDEISGDEIVEMIQEVDRSGDGILDKEDMIRIARQVHL